MVYDGWQASTYDSVLLPEPLGPITAWTSPAFTVRSMPLRISLPPALARNAEGGYLVSYCRLFSSASSMRQDLVSKKRM